MRHMIAVWGQGPWALQLICCGRDDGEARFETWDQADGFRQSYVMAIGHDRAAILKRAAGEGGNGK